MSLLDTSNFGFLNQVVPRLDVSGTRMRPDEHQIVSVRDQGKGTALHMKLSECQTSGCCVNFF